MVDTRRLKLIIAKNPAELARTAAEWICRQAELVAKTRGVVSIGLSGGSTPRPVYEELGNSDLAEKFPWTQAEFYFADERAVPIDDPESNYLLVKDTLLRSHPEAIGSTFRMPADAPDPDEAAARYGRRLPDPLDLLVLGMGEDGHTASLFPGTAAVHEHERPAVAHWVEKLKAYRLTLTPPVLNAAAEIMFLVAGAAKAAVLRQVISGEYQPDRYPAQVVRPTDGTLVWLVDRAAATSV